MPRVYRLPVMNLVCRWWNNELPADLALWTGNVPTRVPDGESVCQLYWPRNSLGRWLHAQSGSAVDTLLKAGTMELRLPRNTNIQTAWGVNPGTDWSRIALVEVPSGSLRLYAVTNVDDAHRGFTNEYRVAILAQLGTIPLDVALGLGLGLSAEVNPSALGAALGLGLGAAAPSAGYGRFAYLGRGLGLSAFVVPSFELAYLGLGLGAAAPSAGYGRFAYLGLGRGLGATVDPSALGAALGLGLGESATAGAAAFVVSLGVGLGADVNANPTPLKASLGLGLGLSATVTSGGGTVTPSTTCAGAPLVTLPFNQSGTVPTSGTHWFKFTATAVLTHIRVTCPPGNYSPGSLNSGACGSQSQLVTTDSITTCRTTTPSAGTIYIRIDGSLFGAINYTVDVGTGSC